MRVLGNFPTVRWGIKGRVRTPAEGRRVAAVQGLFWITKAGCRTLSTYAWEAGAQSIKNGLHPEARTVSLARHGHVWGHHV